MLTILLQFMERRTKSEVLLLAFYFSIIVGLIDYATGYEISLSVLYLGPVVFAAWYAGRRPGLIIAIISSFIALNADAEAGHIYSHWSIPFWNTTIRFTFLTFNVLLLDAFHKQLEAAKLIARIDPLTGVLNTRTFDEQLQKIILMRQENNPFTLIYIDLDNFKQINDSYGHLEGDRILRAVGKAMASAVRTEDEVARLGGDEFAMLLPNSDSASAKRVLEKLRQRLAEIDTDGAQITCSFGVVTFLKPPASSTEAMRFSDQLMYMSKLEGKGRASFGVFDGVSCIQKTSNHVVEYKRRQEDVD